jgi:diguanylate cyclase (GGDEF)-like protein
MDGLRILLVEDNPGDARLIQEALSEVDTAKFALDRADRLSTALTVLAQNPPDLVLLDLSLPDSHGLETFAKVHAAVPEVPVVVLSGFDDSTTAAHAVDNGAQDYLVKGTVDGPALARALDHAHRRARQAEQLRHQAIVDELTGLYNRRGFLALGGQDLKVAARAGKARQLVYVDLNGMKRINDSLGHEEGDRAVVDTAAVLSDTFRGSDIVARVGGDEFCLLIDPGACGEAPLDRLQSRLAQHNATFTRGYRLSMSVGVSTFDPSDPVTIDELLRHADAAMYEQKRSRRRRLLVVDDDVALVRLVASVFDDFEVSHATTGEDAVRQALIGDPEIILLDLGLPDGNGLKVADRIRGLEATSRIPIVILTANDERDTELRCLRAGVADFVTKPVEVDILRARIENVLLRTAR